MLRRAALSVKVFVTSPQNRSLLIVSVFAILGLAAVRWMLPDEAWRAAACGEGEGISCAAMKIVQVLALIDLYVGVFAVVVGWIQQVGDTPASKSRGFTLILCTAIVTGLMTLCMVVLRVILS